MKNVYFIQASLSYGKTHYLPYAPGCLAAYAWRSETVKREFTIAEFIFKRDPVDGIVQRMDDPVVAAFSCYAWTMEYNKKLAAALKQRYPGCLIVFGGHQISENDESLLELPFVDVYIFGEGERPFRQLLEAYAGNSDFSEIPNIAYRRNGELIKTPRVSHDDLDGYVSPYLEGYFDRIISDNLGMDFSAVIETNRGCPYKCAYCDWSFSTHIREFPLEKIKQEIIWCSYNHIEYVFCADSNFGILKRDLDIAGFVVDVHRRSGYPKVFNVSFAKNCNDTVFEISRLFYDSKINKATTLAYQTVNSVALENINRKNFSMEAFSDLARRFNESNIPTYTEMILGLPGETYESFCEGLCKLIEAGQHNSLTVYYCQVYKNSPMGSKAYKEKYGIQTAHVPVNYWHTSKPKNDDIPEYLDQIIATKDMPFRDMVRAVTFCTCLQCFHHIGLLKFFAIFARNELNVSYLDFYSDLLSFILSAEGTFLNKLFVLLENQCSSFSNGDWSYYNEAFGEIGWYLEEGAFMEIVSNFDVFWTEIMPFLKRFHIEQELFDQLCEYQRFVIRLPGQERVSGIFRYDFYHYFQNAIASVHMPLENKKNRIEINIETPVYNWKEYAKKVILFAKRHGDTIIVNDKKNLTVTYI